ncbi:MAG: hypothetical protein HQ556_13835, partial [Candidatus Marinimicrobia bacterium]|nr:hypothetical protein [Candidatus Neomarinimicrobiota bacterium]
FRNALKTYRLNQYEYFNYFFFLDSVPELVTIKGKNVLEGLLKAPDNISGIEEYLNSQIVKEISYDKRMQAHYAMRGYFYSLSPVPALILLLEAYGKIAWNLSIVRGLDLLSEKSMAAASVWVLARRLKDQNILDYLLKVLDMEISDEFHSNIISYTLKTEELDFILEISPDDVQSLKQHYKNNCTKRFYTNEGVRNIFDPKISDAPWQVIYSWKACISPNESAHVSDYISRMMETYPDTLKDVLDNFLSANFESFDDTLKAIGEIISITQLRTMLASNEKLMNRLEEEDLSSYKELILKG